MVRVRERAALTASNQVNFYTGRQGAALRVGRAVRASGEDVGVGLAARVHATGDGVGDGECDVRVYASECDGGDEASAGSQGSERTAGGDGAHRLQRSKGYLHNQNVCM